MKQIVTLCLVFVLIHLTTALVAQEVKLNTNLAVEEDGTLRMDGTATVWDDLMVYPDATNRGNSNYPVWGGQSATAFREMLQRAARVYFFGCSLHPRSKNFIFRSRCLIVTRWVQIYTLISTGLLLPVLQQDQMLFGD